LYDPVTDDCKRAGRHGFLDLTIFAWRAGFGSLEKVIETWHFLYRSIVIAG